MCYINGKKKMFCLMLITFSIIVCSSCGVIQMRESSTASIDDFEGSSAYGFGFDEYYTSNEYVDLITNLRNLMNDPSIEPVLAINKDVFFVKRTLSTYNEYDEQVGIVNSGGEVITQWQTDWNPYDIQYNAQTGDRYFVYAYSHRDVVNQEGKIIASINCGSNRYDIGEGYAFFAYGNDTGYIITPECEVIELGWRSYKPGYGQASYGGRLSEAQKVGKISEGLFYGMSAYDLTRQEGRLTVAYYYNTRGEVVIDLSSNIVNFYVTKLSDFSNGCATIEFDGANGKQYRAVIDQTGSFLEEPVER